jgi:superfamily II DNA or RNA helicase
VALKAHKKLRVVWAGPLTVLDTLLRVPKDLVDMDVVKQDLTLRNDAYWKAVMHGQPTRGVKPWLELYRETETHVLVPRHYHVSWIGDRPYIRDERPNGCGTSVEHAVTLRDDDAVQEEASAALQEPGDKIISLACGKGKTVVTLHASAECSRLPMLVVVPSNAIMSGWKKAFAKFWPGVPIGHIQGPVSRWQGYPAAIAMLHSLVLKNYPPEFYKYWRLVAFDEVHRLGAQFFQEAAPMFACERWGLSATVDREDHMDKVFRLHLGPVVYKDLKQPLQAKVYFINTGVRIANMRPFIMRGGRLNVAKLQTTLSQDEKRNELIQDCLEKALAKGRTPLVLGERLAQLYEMNELFQGRGHDAALHVGAMKENERNDALTHRCVFATQHLAREGLDRPAFDTLILTVPFGGKARLQQSIGRILRLHDGKKSPKVFIFVDEISIIQALANKMRRWLKKEEFEIKELTVRR